MQRQNTKQSIERMIEKEDEIAEVNYITAFKMNSKVNALFVKKKYMKTYEQITITQLGRCADCCAIIAIGDWETSKTI